MEPGSTRLAAAAAAGGAPKGATAAAAAPGAGSGAAADRAEISVPLGAAAQQLGSPRRGASGAAGGEAKPSCLQRSAGPLPVKGSGGDARGKQCGKAGVQLRSEIGQGGVAPATGSGVAASLRVPALGSSALPASGSGPPSTGLCLKPERIQRSVVVQSPDEAAAGGSAGAANSEQEQRDGGGAKHAGCDEGSDRDVKYPTETAAEAAGEIPARGGGTGPEKRGQSAAMQVECQV